MRLVWVVIPLVLIGIIGIEQSFGIENSHTIDFQRYGNDLQVNYLIDDENFISNLEHGRTNLTLYLNATSDGTLSFPTNGFNHLRLDNTCHPEKLEVRVDDQLISPSEYKFRDSIFYIDFIKNTTKISLSTYKSPTYDKCVLKYTSSYQTPIKFDNFYYIFYHTGSRFMTGQPEVTNITHDSISNEISFNANSENENSIAVSISPDFLVSRNNCQSSTSDIITPSILVNEKEVHAKELGSLKKRLANISYDVPLPFHGQ